MEVACYPLVAPLPVPFAEHALANVQQRQPPEAAWKTFEEELREKRRVVFNYMNPFVLGHLRGSARGSVDRYSTAWFLKTLTAHTPGKRPVVKQNLSLWADKGIYRAQEHGLPNVHNAAALLIERLLDQKRLRGWHPSSMEAHEPLWWCWRQDTPFHTPVPCPVPLPPNLPASALLWTPWSGAAWDAGWLLIDAKLGAIGWAATTRSRVDGRHLWNIPEEFLLQWDAALVPLAQDLHDPNLTPFQAQNIRHSLATLALQRLARTRLVV
jgi:hypothetical protein